MIPPQAPLAARPALAGATVVVHMRLGRGARGRHHLAPASPAPPAADLASPGRVPRVARMMALAIHWQGLIRTGVVGDQAALSRLVGVTRARVTQVMDLLRLAPDLQEEVLFLPLTVSGRDEVRHRDLLRIVAEPLWNGQRHRWAREWAFDRNAQVFNRP